MKTSRNDPCPCGSGKKYKHCCYAKDSVKHESSEQQQSASGDDPVDTHDTHEAQHAGSGSTSQHSHKPPKEREKGHGRFPGDKRSGGSTFIPRTSRGSQRGN